MMKGFRHDKLSMLKAFDKRVTEFRVVLAKLTPKHHQAETFAEIIERSRLLLLRAFDEDTAAEFIANLEREGADQKEWIVARRRRMKRAITEMDKYRIRFRNT